MSTTTSTAAAVPATANLKICFNSLCKEPKSEAQRRKGWKLRSGDHAELCDRCSCAYEQGTFCETFHLDAAGWRKCESCGKRVHCGCIVSASSYVLLDAGGIECILCAKKTLSMTPNSMWSPSLILSSQVSERPKEHAGKSWHQMTGSFPSQWRQGPHLWSTGIQSDLQQRLSYEFDRPLHSERLIAGVRASISAQDKKVAEPSERLTPGNHVLRNGTVAGLDAASVFNMYREEGNVLQDSGHHLGDNDLGSSRKGVVTDPCSASTSGVNFESRPNSYAKPLQSTILKGESSPLLGLAASFSSPNGSNGPGRASMTQSQRQMPPPIPKQLSSNPHNLNDNSVEVRSGRSRVDARTRTQLLPRYWPRITDQELKQINGDSNSVITPLFEKMLSASDAGRIGRLVLPKKCAEAYFPPISQPEGLPLKVQDASGKEWAFQFRFWPNNNSRMYVLEGVTPCIQSMQLQAGDTVTFSRIDPEGKLVMGFRKASNASSEQDAQTVKTGNGFLTPPENNKNATDFSENGPFRSQKVGAESKSSSNTTDEAILSKFGKNGFIQKDGSATKLSHGPSRRKGGNLGSRNKRLRIESEDSIELKVTWEQAQELLRPPPNDNPNVVVIEGHEIEEYEESPVLGKPTIFTTNQAGENIQWAQCEDCFKWRKLPVDALLPSKWTCSENKWDPERSSCSTAQEIDTELADILPTTAGSRRSRVKLENNNLEVSDGLDTLANLAILGEGECLPPSSQPTTKHPRHRPGCTCIVCIQPPSGKGPKHKQSCTCNVCLTVKRRFRTLMLRREKKQTEKEAETSKKQIVDQSLEMMISGSEPLQREGKCIGDGSLPQSPVICVEGEFDNDAENRVISPSPLKAQIDLNIQPEREEEPSPKSDTGSIMRPFADATA
ncbi:uncharacterized protein A4U43_C03F22580 [Asparagus officinalis]|uniref:B3 domain-containing protein n=1 Tax=Asparagus officinalis TaxID=4686 RepID=A0A5P1FHB5_ASPOF|nr:B3 domain-containing protein Os07g0563300-like [Asparagus officinalis]ONK75980.1 uncharacterized protein A4U43_C03F22580 [Asparagus officinalis]